jgi:zinc protease
VAATGIGHQQPVLRQIDADLRLLPVNISFSKHTLANGLDVLLHEDHACPIVAVNLWYHVGSKNERPGHTGFAHLFEHLMFEGSQHHDKGYFSPLQGAGATLNGSTNADRTNYWEVVPAGALELALWMESDRMGYLLPALTQAKFSNQRDVVLNERRQNYENRPYGLAPMALLAALFPEQHPYHWTTIGEIADLQAVQLDEVHAFFRRYYHPANASIALAGDIDSADALALVDQYFGEIDPGDDVDPVRATAMLDGEVRIQFEDRVELPRLYLAWLTPAMFAEADADLDLATDLLANGKTSRLYRRLVFEERLATDVSASQNSREIAGYAQITATAAPGHTLGEIERVIVEEIDRLATDGPTDEEMERGRVQAEAQFMFRLQTVGGFGGKSDQLNAYNVFLQDPAYFDRDLARYQVVTNTSLQDAVRQHLDPARRVTLSIVPQGRTALAAPNSITAAVS